MSSNSYPVFLVPLHWHDPMKYIDVPKEVLKPKRPVLESTDESILNTGCIVSLVGLALIIISYIIGMDKTAGLGATGVMILVMSGWIHMWTEGSQEAASERVATLNAKRIITYENEKLCYEKYVVETNQLNEISNLSQSQIRNKIYKNKNFSVNDEGYFKNTTVGISENYFHRFLKREFSSNILVGKCVEFMESGIEYYPDFIFYDQDNGIYIDIEIDEPYSFKNMIPIHFGDSDKDRDNRFVSNKWCVLRFSEQQVVNHPEDCIKTMKSAINYLRFDGQEWKCSIARHLRWSEEAAYTHINLASRTKLLTEANII